MSKNLDDLKLEIRGWIVLIIMIVMFIIWIASIYFTWTFLNKVIKLEESVTKMGTLLDKDRKFIVKDDEIRYSTEEKCNQYDFSEIEKRLRESEPNEE